MNESDEENIRLVEDRALDYARNPIALAHAIKLVAKLTEAVIDLQERVSCLEAANE